MTIGLGRSTCTRAVCRSLGAEFESAHDRASTPRTRESPSGAGAARVSVGWRHRLSLLMASAHRAHGATTVIDQCSQRFVHRRPVTSCSTRWVRTPGWRRVVDAHDRRGGCAGRLPPADHTVIPDRIEAATYLCAVGITGGEITVAGARHEHMSMLCQKLGEMGMRISHDPDGDLGLRPSASVGGLQSLPYPGIATDYKPFIVTLLATAEGVGIVIRPSLPGRRSR